MKRRFRRNPHSHWFESKDVDLCCQGINRLIHWDKANILEVETTKTRPSHDGWYRLVDICPPRRHSGPWVRLEGMFLMFTFAQDELLKKAYLKGDRYISFYWVDE